MSRLLDTPGSGLTYEASGVSIDAGDDAVARIKKMVQSTHGPQVLGGIGGFGGLFTFDQAAFERPILVTSTDGVGTKLDIARRVGRYDTVGLDLVAMLVDDIACVGATPLFLLDYVAVGRLDPDRIEEIVRGIVEGCRLTNTALLGGEMAEHAGVMAAHDVDVAGFVVGVVDSGSELGPQHVHAGDVLVGLASPGLRSNGYSLARRVLVDNDQRLAEPAFVGSARNLGDELLLPSLIYTPAVLELRRAIGHHVHAAAHVTGGGIVANVSRALPATLDANVDMSSFPTPEIFFEIQRRGSVSAEEMVRVFNCGLGMVLMVDPASVEATMDIVSALNVEAYVVGATRPGSGQVVLT